jgi:diamine N-acetyltransferase
MLAIRAATLADAALIGRLISELADFEKKADQVRTTPADIARDGFGANPRFRALIAEWRGQPAGFALFFSYYSTWRGSGLYLEDLFVRPAFRGRGIGKALLARVAVEAEQENSVFLRWTVLNWNQSAIAMYKALGADFLDDWRSVLLAGDGLRKLMEKDSAEKDSGERDA